MIFTSLRKLTGLAGISLLAIGSACVVNAKGKHILAENAENVILFLNFLLITENGSINPLRDHSRIYFGGAKAEKQIICSKSEIQNATNSEIFCNAVIATTIWEPNYISIFITPMEKKVCDCMNFIASEKNILFSRFGSLIYKDPAERDRKRNLLRDVVISVSPDCSRITIR